MLKDLLALFWEIDLFYYFYKYWAIIYILEISTSLQRVLSRRLE
jgi:hypothetical protein